MELIHRFSAFLFWQRRIMKKQKLNMKRRRCQLPRSRGSRQADAATSSNKVTLDETIMGDTT